MKRVNHCGLCKKVIRRDFVYKVGILGEYVNYTCLNSACMALHEIGKSFRENGVYKALTLRIMYENGSDVLFESDSTMCFVQESAISALTKLK